MHAPSIFVKLPVTSRRSPEMGELKDCAASLVNIVNCSSVTSAQSEQAMAMLQAGNPQVPGAARNSVAGMWTWFPHKIDFAVKLNAE